MSPGKRRRVTFADEPSIVTFEKFTDQSALGEDGKPAAGLDCLDMCAVCAIIHRDFVIVPCRLFRAQGTWHPRHRGYISNLL